MKDILVVDWDFFFHAIERPQDGLWELYDWGHAESVYFIHMAWENRATAFVRNGLELPDLTGEQEGFWDRFKFSEDAKLYIAESNCMTAAHEVVGNGRVAELWLYDAHHDSGYKQEDPNELVNKGVWHCDNWMALYDAIGADLHMRYPRWRHYGMESEPEPIINLDRQVDAPNNGPDVEFDTVFLCRSGAWVPPWHDQAFLDFAHEFPGDEVVQVDDTDLTPRAFSMDNVRELATLLDQMDREMRERMAAKEQA